MLEMHESSQTDKSIPIICNNWIMSIRICIYMYIYIHLLLVFSFIVSIIYFSLCLEFTHANTHMSYCLKYMVVQLVYYIGLVMGF